MSENMIEKARLLYGTHRYKEADKAVREAIASNPDDPDAYLLSAEIYNAMDKHDDAVKRAKECVTLAPEWAAANWVLGKSFLLAGNKAEAKKALEESMRLDPEDPDNHLLLSSMLSDEGKNKEGLELVNEGLKIAPEHIGLLKVKGGILEDLNKMSEAKDIYNEILRLDPENPDAKSRLGFVGLSEGKGSDSLEYFRQALKDNPNKQEYKTGLILAMKSRYPFFGLWLRFVLWIAKLDNNVRVGLLIGVYILFRGLRAVAETYPAVAPFVVPLLAAYVGFIIFSWLADPVLNMLLYLNPYGRYALDGDEKTGAKIFALVLALIPAMVLADIFIIKESMFYFYFVFALSLFAVSGITSASGRKRTVLAVMASVYITAGLTGALMGTFKLFSGAGGLQSGLLLICILVFGAFTWTSSLMKEKA